MQLVTGGIAVQRQRKISFGKTAAVGIGVHDGKVHHNTEMIQPLLLQPAAKALQCRALRQQQRQTLRLLFHLLHRSSGSAGIVEDAQLVAPPEICGGAAVGVAYRAQCKALRRQLGIAFIHQPRCGGDYAPRIFIALRQVAAIDIIVQAEAVAQGLPQGSLLQPFCFWIEQQRNGAVTEGQKAGVPAGKLSQRGSVHPAAIGLPRQKTSRGIILSQRDGHTGVFSWCQPRIAAIGRQTDLAVFPAPHNIGAVINHVLQGISVTGMGAGIVILPAGEGLRLRQLFQQQRLGAA